MLATKDQERAVRSPIEAFRQTADLPWGIRSLRLHRGIEEALADRDTFAAAANLIADHLADRGIGSVLGASPLGQRLAEAVADRIGATIGPSTDTAIIEGVANTGIQLAEAWRLVADAGRAPVAAIALVAQREVVDAWTDADRKLDAIEVL